MHDTTPTTPRRRRPVKPGPKPFELKLEREHLVLLSLLARLRVVTSYQAHWLIDEFSELNPATGKGRTERNTRLRVAALERAGYLRGQRARPYQGLVSESFYQLTYKGMSALGLREEQLLARPVQHILDYLLFRNDVYASAREAGFYVGSPVLHPPKAQELFLRQFSAWATREARSALSSTKEAGQPPQSADAELLRIKTLLPKELTFEFLSRVGPAGEVTQLVLLVVDDPRRRIQAVSERRKGVSKERCETCGQPLLLITSTTKSATSKVLRCPTPKCASDKALAPPAPAQEKDLPPALFGASVLIRDHLSRFDAEQGLVHESDRLARWRRALSKKYGKHFLEERALFPELWAQRIRKPRRKAAVSTQEES